MTLNETIENDIKLAMKSGDKLALSVLRMLKTAMQASKVNQRDTLSDEEVIVILKKQVKQRRESILEFNKYGRTDLAEATEAEINILEKYLPEEISEEELDNIINLVFDEVKPEGIRDMGKVMSLVSEKCAGRADMSKVSEAVKMRLN